MLSVQSLTLVALVASCVAHPTALSPYVSLPERAKILAHDRKNNMFIAYDEDMNHIGNFLNRSPQLWGMAPVKRQGGACAPLSADDVQRIPDWQTMLNARQANWGSDSFTVHTNDPNYPEYDASVCISGEIAQVQFDGDPSCTTQSAETGGTLIGTSGTAAIQVQTGTTQQTTVTVTTQSQIGLSITTTAEVNVPDVVSVSTSLQSSIQITNSLASTTSFTTTDMTTETITMTAPVNQTCTLTFDNINCQAQGQGEQTYTATGWVWFYHKHKHDGHWDWALYMDAFITDPAGRSSQLEFQTSTSAQSNANYVGTCSP